MPNLIMNSRKKLEWKRIPFETRWHRQGGEQGRIEGYLQGMQFGALAILITVLKTRFPTIRRATIKQVEQIDDYERVIDLTRVAATAPSLQDFLLEMKAIIQ